MCGCGGMYDILDTAAEYDTGGSPCLRTHGQWAASLQCKALRLNGEDDLHINMECIVREYLRTVFAT